MATKTPSKGTAVNNYSGAGPVNNTGASQPAVGGSIKTTTMKPTATFAGHGQVNPGSKR